MPKTHWIQYSLNGGEISPLLEGRLDLQQYYKCVRNMENVIALPQGGATRRGGWHFVDFALPENSILVPFIYSAIQGYQVEFGDLKCRFYMDGYLIHRAIGQELLENGDFTYDIGYWTDVSTGTGSIAYSGGKLRLAGGVGGIGWGQQAIPTVVGEAYSIFFDVSTNTLRIRIGTTTSGNEILADTNKAAGSHVVIFTATTTTTYIQFDNPNNNNADLDNVECKFGTELLPNPTLNTDIAGYTNLSTGTGLIAAVGGAMTLNGGIIGIGWAEEEIVTVAGTQYSLYVDVTGYPIDIRVGSVSGDDDIVADRTIAVGTQKQVIFTATGATTFIGFKNPNNNIATIDNLYSRKWMIYEIESPYYDEDLPLIRYKGTADDLYIVHPDYPPYKLTRIEHNDWTLEPIVFIDGPYLDEITTSTITTDATAIGDTVHLVASVPLFDQLHEGSLWRLKNVATWGYVEITSVEDSTHAHAVIRTTLGAAGATVAYREGAWSDYRGYPGAINLAESRLILCGNDEWPEGIWGSKSGVYEDMTPGVLDADAFSYRLSSSQNLIRWMETTKVILIGTLGGEYKMTGGSDNPISPTNIDVDSETDRGSANIAPIRVKNSILFVQKAGRKIIELVYSWESEGFKDTDLTILAEHLTIAGIKKMVYQQEPNSSIWVLDNDGNLIGITFNRQENIVGFHHHPTDGTVEDISVIPSSVFMEDELWAIINRTIGGVETRCIERMDPELNTDCALTYVGSLVSTVSGLDHLIGETVDIVGDGAVYPEQVVDGFGEVALVDGPAASEIEVGLHYDSEIEILRPEIPVNGTSQGIPKSWIEVWVRLYESIGVNIAGEQLSFRTSDDLTGEGLGTFTGDKKVNKLGWDKDGRFKIRQEQPLPLTVLSVFGTIDLGD